MLLLRCSLDADSMSRSISFWPSTIATRSSSAWVALNSMRFMGLFLGAIVGAQRADGTSGTARDGRAAGDAYAVSEREDGRGPKRGRDALEGRGGLRISLRGRGGLPTALVTGLLVRER